MTKQNQQQTLETWISKALLPESKTSADDLQALLEGIRQGIEDADKVANDERNRSLNPLLPSAEAEACAQRASLAELRRDRFKAALAPIETKLKEACAADYKARWEIRRAEVMERRNAIAEKYETIPAKFDELISIFNEAAAIDEEVDSINGQSPGGVTPLSHNELYARDLAGFSQLNPSIAKNTVLPSWSRSSEDAWPLTKSSVNNLASLMFSGGGGSMHPAGNWWRESQVRDEAQARERERLDNYYKNQTAKKEEMNNAEIKAAREAAMQRRG